MGLRNTTTEWGWPAKALHWLVAIGILALLVLGLVQDEMPKGDARTGIRMIHGSIGLVVLVLMSIRLAWRWMNQTPAHPAGLPAWQNLAATLVHWGLYVAVYVQLVAGAMAVATAGSGLPFFGLFRLALPVAESHDAHELWEEIHESFWVVIVVLVAAHVGAALYHHFVVKSDVLRRMTHG